MALAVLDSSIVKELLDGSGDFVALLSYQIDNFSQKNGNVGGKVDFIDCEKYVKPRDYPGLYLAPAELEVHADEVQAGGEVKLVDFFIFHIFYDRF